MSKGCQHQRRGWRQQTKSTRFVHGACKTQQDSTRYLPTWQDINGQRGHCGLAVAVLGVHVHGGGGANVAIHWVKDVGAAGSQGERADGRAGNRVGQRDSGASGVDLRAARNAEASHLGGGASGDVGVVQRVSGGVLAHGRGHSVRGI